MLYFYHASNNCSDSEAVLCLCLVVAYLCYFDVTVAVIVLH